MVLCFNVMQEACAYTNDPLLQMVTYHNPVLEGRGGTPHSLFLAVLPKPCHNPESVGNKQSYCNYIIRNVFNLIYNIIYSIYII